MKMIQKYETKKRRQEVSGGKQIKQKPKKKNSNIKKT